MIKPAPTAMADVASPGLDKRIEESIAKAVPVILAKFFFSGGFVSFLLPPFFMFFGRITANLGSFLSRFSFVG